MATREYVKTSEMDATAFARSSNDGLTTFKRVIHGAGAPVLSPSTLTDQARDVDPIVYIDVTNDEAYFWEPVGFVWFQAAGAGVTVSSQDPGAVAVTLNGTDYEVVLPWVEVNPADNTEGNFLNPVASGDEAIAIGVNAQATGYRSFVAGGNDNTSGGTLSFTSGDGNTATGARSIAMGDGNTAQNNWDAVLSGVGNVASGSRAAIVAGFQCQATGPRSFVGNGNTNICGGTDSAILTGSNCTTVGNNAIVLGGPSNTSTASVVYGSANDAQAGSNLATILGGANNTGTGQFYTILGGNGHTVSSDSAGIFGGTGHIVATSPTSGIVAGASNSATGATSCGIFAGSNNDITASRATIVGGNANTASGGEAAIIGSTSSTASALSTGIVGGEGSTATADYGQVFGPFGNAVHAGAKVFTAGTVGVQTSSYVNEIVFATDIGLGSGSAAQNQGGITNRLGLQAMRFDAGANNDLIGAADPTPVANTVQLFVRGAAGAKELHVMNEIGTVTQLSSHAPAVVDIFKEAGIISESLPSDLYKLDLSSNKTKFLAQTQGHALMADRKTGAYDIVGITSGEVVVSGTDAELFKTQD
jgi:hypothetical protein